MPFIPITPVSPDLTLVKPIGASETSLGPIANVGDGIPGIGGIGSVEMPGTGVITAPSGGFTIPDITNLTASAPSGPAPSAAPGGVTAPEVTPFPVAGPLPSAAPTVSPAPLTLPAQTGAQTQAGTQTPVGGQLQQPQQGSPYSTQPITTDQIPALVQTPFTPTTTSGVPVKGMPLAQTFGKYLQDAAGNYNEVQNQANDMIQRLASGEKVDIHDVSLALQKASITNQLAIQVRNSLVSAYQEVMRMQM